jgi:hypothetical protein
LSLDEQNDAHDDEDHREHPKQSWTHGNSVPLRASANSGPWTQRRARRRPAGIECASGTGRIPGSAPYHLDAISVGRRAADPYVDRSAKAPAGLPELNALAQVIAMSVDSRPSPDRHPSGSGGSSDVLIRGSNWLGTSRQSAARVDLAREGSGDAIGAHERNRVIEPHLGPSPSVVISPFRARLGPRQIAPL